MRKGLASLLVLVSIDYVAAQSPRPPLPERGVELLAIDFAAVTADGTPVTDLAAGEVTLRVGGRVRPIRSLQLVSAGDDAEHASDAAGGEALPPPFGSNASTETGRSLVLIVADDSFRPGRETPLRDAVDLVTRRLHPHDRISLVTMPYGGIKVPFTTDHSRVRVALSKIVGRAPADQSGSGLACETRRTLESLTAYFDTLGIRQEPTTVMFITAGLAAPRRDAPVMLGPGICELTRQLFEQVGVAAGAARAQFYVIQPMDLFATGASVQRENIAGVGYSGSDNPIEGIENIAGVTGGKILALTGSPETALGRVLRESSAHYVAAITPDRNDRSGRSQQLQVKVTRPGVEVRARPHITFAKPDPALGRPVEPSPRDMLSVATVFRDLPLRASGFVALDPGGESMRIVTVTEPVEPGIAIASLMAALFDGEGRSVSHWSATSEELQRTPIVGAMPAAPGAYRLRVAAIDATGRSGSVDFEVNAETPKTGPLTLSSLVLGLSRGGTFTPRLLFTTEPVAIGYVELYGAAAGARVNATLELARTLNGPALLTVPLAIESAGPNRYGARGAIPIGTLAPGDYIVRALVGLEGHPMTRVVRTLRKAAAR